jgi:hypothetical protein
MPTLADYEKGDDLYCIKCCGAEIKEAANMRRS